MIREAQTSVELNHIKRVFEERNPTLIMKFYKDLERGCLQVLARQKPVEPLRYIVQTLRAQRAPWTTSWWARLIRKVTSWKWFRDWFYPLRCLANAQQVEIGTEVRTIDNRIIAEIREQIYMVQMSGYEPYSILLGSDMVPLALTDFSEYSMFRPMDSSVYQTATIFGIPVYSYSFLDKNTILVVPRHDKTR